MAQTEELYFYENENEVDGDGTQVVLALERKSVQGYKSKDEYVVAMKEDLAEWFNILYKVQIAEYNFMEILEDGVLLCHHANKVNSFILDILKEEATNNNSSTTNGCTNNRPKVQLVDKEIQYRVNVQPGSFQCRDNISNFISWCRGLGISDVLLFESDDLVMRKNERNFVLCLLEVARRGAKFGMLAPMLIQMEQEIDAEIAGEEPPPKPPQPPRERRMNDLMSLDEMVRDLVNRCTCPDQFPIIRVAEGKYKIGENQTLIFVRILRNHVMVRIGGGWDTLENYLNRHDPCRCGSKVTHGRSGRSTPVSMAAKRRGSAPSATHLQGVQLTTKTVTKESTVRAQSPMTTNGDLNSSHNYGAKRKSVVQQPNRRASIATPSGSSRTLPKTPSFSGADRRQSVATSTKYQRPQSARPDLQRRPSSSLDDPIKVEELRKPSTYKTRGRSPSPGPARESPQRGRESPRLSGRESPRLGGRESPRHVRSRSVGPEEMLKGFSQPNGNMASQKGQEVMMVTRDASGRHRIGPMTAGDANGATNGNNNEAPQRRISSARVMITPDKILPSKPMSVQRTASNESCESSRSRTSSVGLEIDKLNRSQSAHSGFEPGPMRLTRTFSVESEPPLNEMAKMQDGRTTPTLKRQDSSSFSLASSFEDYPDAPGENPGLNEQMEALFEEYRKIELMTSRAREESPEIKVAPSTPKLKKRGDYSHVQSKIGAYVSQPVRPKSATPASRKSSFASVPVRGNVSGTNGSNINSSHTSTPRRPSRAPSPGPSQIRPQSATPDSKPKSSFVSTPVRPSSAFGARKPSHKSTENLLDSTDRAGKQPVRPSSAMGRPSTPTSMFNKTVHSSGYGQRGSSVPRGTSPVPRGTSPGPRPTTPASQRRMLTSKSSDNILGSARLSVAPTKTATATPTGRQSTNPATDTNTAPRPRQLPRQPRSSSVGPSQLNKQREREQSKSRESLDERPTRNSRQARVDTGLNRTQPVTPSNTSTPAYKRPQSARTVRSQTPSRVNVRSTLRSRSKDDLLDDDKPTKTTNAFTLSNPEQVPFTKDQSPSELEQKLDTVRAKPRKDKQIETLRTRIPGPTDFQQKGLKRVDSGVDINHMYESSVNGDETPESPNAPWLSTEGQAMGGQPLSFQQDDADEYY